MSCKPETFVPKPMGYFKLDTPATHNYGSYDMPGFPYTFEYPAYCRIERDTAFFKEKADNPYWININFVPFNGIINLTYKHVSSRTELMHVLEDSHRLTDKHSVKADYIDEKEYMNANGVHGILYIVGGNAASRYQFTATDSMNNFIRGALYFNVNPNADSLKPITDFVEADIKHFLETLRFR